MSPSRAYRLLYFSGTGNTHWVFHRLAQALELRGARCELLAVDQLLADCGQGPQGEADDEALRERLLAFLPSGCCLVLGYPVYESTIPRPMRSLLPLLPEGAGRRLGVVCTYMMAGGDCCHLPEAQLEPRGWRSVLATYVKMPNNIKFPAFRFLEIHNGEALLPFADKAAEAVRQIADELVLEREHIEGRGIADYLLGVSQRWSESMVSEYLRAHMFATAACTRCRLCAESCPTGNIHFDRGYPEFSDRCCDCLRCYHGCPACAIQLGEGTMDLQAYPRYRGVGDWKPPRLRRLPRREG
jgi:ferredoxin